MQTILGLDPGRDKCGIAIMNRKYQVLRHQVVDSSQVLTLITQHLSQYSVDLIVLGNGTTSQHWTEKLAKIISTIPVISVNEQNSTLEARDRYWQMYPPQGWQKLIPQGLRVPPVPVDDIVAILLIERYLASETN